MLKKIILFLGKLFLFGSIASVLCSCGVKELSSIDMKNLPGKILIENNVDNKYGNGLIILTPGSSDTLNILNDRIYCRAEFNSDRSSVLAVPVIQEPKPDESTLVEYNLKTGNIKELVKNKGVPPPGYSSREVSTIYYNDIRYVPKKNMVSYLWGNSLYTFDLSTSTETFITKLMGEDSRYSWSKDDGFTAYLSEDDSDMNTSIVSYNVKTKESRRLFNGYSPEISNKNEFIAYEKFNPNTKGFNLVVREVSTAKEWFYKNKGSIVNYRFSPDDRYLAVVERDKKWLANPQTGPIQIWDFKGSTASTLIKNYGGTNLDWK